MLIPDLPGHGRSGPADGPLGMTDVLAGVEALLEAEAPGARASLVGNSMGGWLALLYAQRHPGRVARVVIVNGAGLRGDGSEARVSLLPRTREEARAAMEAVTSPASGAVPNFILDDLVRRAPRSPLARIMAVPFAELLLDGKRVRMPQEQRSERSRGQILDAALRLFSRQGYRGTSMREIALAAKLSTGNV